MSENPKTRGDCECGIRPCPYLNCKYHLYRDIADYHQSIASEVPKLIDMAQTCALDLVDKGITTTKQIALEMGVSESFIMDSYDSGIKKLSKRMLKLKVEYDECSTAHREEQEWDWLDERGGISCLDRSKHVI